MNRFLVPALCLAASSAFAQDLGDCGNPFVNGYGPFDYRTAPPEARTNVETNHFTPAVESLRGAMTGSIGGDIDYTLRAFPNHPRALMAMIRLGQQQKALVPKGAHFTVDCYIERAIAFQPDDPTVREIRGIYLSMNGKYAQAAKDFEAVVAAKPDSGNAHYNLGLAYFELREYDKARAEAKRARELKFPLDGLTKKLKAAGEWDG